MTDHKPLPVAGYTGQNDENCDELRKMTALDQRFVSMAVSHFQEGFMCLNRAIFQPTRIKLPEDGA